MLYSPHITTCLLVPLTHKTVPGDSPNLCATAPAISATNTDKDTKKKAKLQNNKSAGLRGV